MKALFATLWLYSTLFWVYDILRILVNHVKLTSLFLDNVPRLNFVDVGVITFIASMVFMFLYLIQD